jgi:hypothetical protein
VVKAASSSNLKQFLSKITLGRCCLTWREIAEEDTPILDEIALLALKCLKEKVEDRPAMVSVASALVMLKVSWEEKEQMLFTSTSGN